MIHTCLGLLDNQEDDNFNEQHQRQHAQLRAEVKFFRSPLGGKGLQT